MATLLERPRSARRPATAARPARPAALAAAGPRAEGRREEYELLLEAIYEGYLLHYGEPRLVRAPRGRPRPAGGRSALRDRPRAAGRARRHARRSAELADTITLSALAQGAGEPELAEAVWAAGARAVGWGSSAEHRRAKELLRGRAPRRRSRRCAQVRRAPRAAVESRLDIVCGGARQARQAEVEVHARPRDPGRLRGRDGHAPEVHDRAAPTRPGRSPPASFVLPALGFALGPIFKSTPHRWETVGTDRSVQRRQLRPGGADAEPNIGEAGKTTVYVRKFNPTIDTDRYDRGTQFIAISDRCAHLGCPVRWVDAAERFICPCHGGVYDLLGRPVGGPPVRPLDRFYTRVSGNQVQLGPRFSVNSELRPLLAARPGRAARRHRPVPLPVAPRRAETVGTGRTARAMPRTPKLPAPPLPGPLKAPPPRPGEANGGRARTSTSRRRGSPSSTGSTSAPR